MTLKKLTRIEDLPSLYLVEGELCKEITFEDGRYLFPIDIMLPKRAYEVVSSESGESTALETSKRSLLKDLSLYMYEEGFLTKMGLASLTKQDIESYYS